MEHNPIQLADTCYERGLDLLKQVPDETREGLQLCLEGLHHEVVRRQEALEIQENPKLFRNRLQRAFIRGGL